MSRCFLAVVLMCLAGCGQGESEASRVIIPLDQVPEPLMKIAHEKLPEVTFEKAWKKANGDIEVAGKNKKGKIREIDMTPSGEVVEIE